MKTKKRLIQHVLIWLGVFLVAGCSAPVTAPAPALAQQAVRATPTVVATVSAQPEEIEPVDECLRCHLDKQELIDTAKPVVEVLEAENEGEG